MEGLARVMVVLRHVLCAFLLCHAAPCSAGESPRSCSPALEQAALALAQSQFDVAERQFQDIALDASNPPVVRGLAWVGTAETALAKKDARAALRVWRRVADDTALPPWQREFAKRKTVETERRLKGLPERDPASYRLALPPRPKPALTFYVSPNGSDAGSGSKSEPFATLTRARDAIRDLKTTHSGVLPKGGVRVAVQGGNYVLGEPLRLTAEDSGTAEAPVVYAAQPGRTPVFTGGLPLRGWRPVVADTVRARLAAEIAGQVLEADLKANGIHEWGDATALKKRPELFVNGVPQTLARWPNEGFVKTGEILGTNTFKVWGSIPGCRDGKFQFLEDRPLQWLDEPDARLYGYWFWDWFEEYQQVGSIDPGTRSFTLAQPYSNYGYRKNQRYFAANVLSELDAPGEWYLDRRTGKIYWLPPKAVVPARAEIVLSVRSEPFILLKEVRHVLLLGLTFQEGRGDGLHITGGSDCLVAGCTLSRLGGDAVIIDGGLRHNIFGCSMHTLGCGGMRVNGGNRQTLSPGNHVIENCIVSDISRLKRTYAPAVHLDGCGNRVAHNLFERIPSSAMRIEGNDHLIELNHVRNVVQESDDQGGIDMFGNPLYRGVVIRWNRWTDITGGTECGAAGIRLDDMISGAVLHGNLFVRCGAVQFGGVQIHGGKENVVDGNAFVDCYAALSFSRWGETRWVNGIEPFLKQSAAEPYASRYPELARIKQEPDVNFITRNLVLGCKNVFLRDGGVQKSALMFVSEKAAPDEFLKRGRLDDRVLRQILFDPIPVREIGRYSHPWRTGSSRRE